MLAAAEDVILAETVMMAFPPQTSAKGLTGCKVSVPAASIGISSSRDGRRSANAFQLTARHWQRLSMHQQRQRHGLVRCAANSAKDSSIRLFLDSASLSSWDAFAATQMFKGMFKKDGVECSVQSLQRFAATAFDRGATEVQLQTWGDHLAVGRQLAAVDRRVVVKLPITRAGVEAAATLIGEGCRITLTGLYSAHQAFTAAAIGADYAAAYLGRMNDAGKQGQDEILNMQSMKEAVGSSMRILVASIRSPADLMSLASQGCDTFTISPACAAELLQDPLTESAAAAFEESASMMGPKTT